MSGFGLLEILAGLTLLAISMLALINGLLKAQQHSVESLWLAHANVQAENIYEKKLSNVMGNYFQTPHFLNDCSVCTPDQQAAKDLITWQQQLQKSIAGSEAEIIPFFDAQKIIIRWPPLWVDKSNNKTDKLSEWILYGGS